LFKAKRRLDIHGPILPAMEAQCAVQWREFAPRIDRPEMPVG